MNKNILSIFSMLIVGGFTSLAYANEFNFELVNESGRDIILDIGYLKEGKTDTKDNKNWGQMKLIPVNKGGSSLRGEKHFLGPVRMKISWEGGDGKTLACVAFHSSKGPRTLFLKYNKDEKLVAQSGTTLSMGKKNARGLSLENNIKDKDMQAVGLVWGNCQWDKVTWRHGASEL